MIPGLKSTNQTFKDKEPKPRHTNKTLIQWSAWRCGWYNGFYDTFLRWPSSPNQIQWLHQYKMWRCEDCANGCLSGWKFLPGTQTSTKQKTKQNEQLTLLDWQSGKTPEKTNKKSTHREGLRSWTGDMGWVFFCFCFFHGFTFGWK